MTAFESQPEPARVPGEQVVVIGFTEGGTWSDDADVLEWSQHRFHLRMHSDGQTRTFHPSQAFLWSPEYERAVTVNRVNGGIAELHTERDGRFSWPAELIAQNTGVEVERLQGRRLMGQWSDSVLSFRLDDGS